MYHVSVQNVDERKRNVQHYYEVILFKAGSQRVPYQLTLYVLSRSLNQVATCRDLSRVSATM